MTSEAQSKSQSFPSLRQQQKAADGLWEVCPGWCTGLGRGVRGPCCLRRSSDFLATELDSEMNVNSEWHKSLLKAQCESWGNHVKKYCECDSDSAGSTFYCNLWIPMEPGEFPFSGAALYCQVPSQLPSNHEKCSSLGLWRSRSHFSHWHFILPLLSSESEWLI